MLELLFSIILFAVFAKVICFVIGLSFGALRLVLSVVLFPLYLVIALISGLMKIALPVLIVVGIIYLIKYVKNV